MKHLIQASEYASINKEPLFVLIISFSLSFPLRADGWNALPQIWLVELDAQHKQSGREPPHLLLLVGIRV